MAKLYAVISTDRVDARPDDLSYPQVGYAIVERSAEAHRTMRFLLDRGDRRVIIREVPPRGTDPLHDGLIVKDVVR